MTYTRNPFGSNPTGTGPRATRTRSKLPALLDELEELSACFVGKKAEGEQWGKTLERFERIAKLTKAVRKEQGGHEDRI